MNLKKKADQLIKRPYDTKELVFRKGVTADIMKSMLYADRFIAEDTHEFAKFFDTDNQYESLRKLWKMVRYDIKYVEDPVGDERIQLPSYLWWKTKAGDCKSKTLFCASIALNLGIPYAYRFTAYKYEAVNGIGRLKDEVSRLFNVPAMPVNVKHVYLVLYPDTEDEIIIDTVYNRFDDEADYIYAIDYNPATQTFTQTGNVGASINSIPVINGALKIAAGLTGIYFLMKIFKNANTDKFAKGNK